MSNREECRRSIGGEAASRSDGERKDRAETGATLASPVPARRDHLVYLDGLRGVAILLVLMVHSGQLVAGLAPWLRNLTFYGVRGVQLFFIVSGLTLMLNHAGRPFRPADFAARRFFRIAPMFYLGAAIYLCLAAATAIDLPTRRASAMDVVATLAFLHGWLRSAINTVVPGGWSIAAEAMFYLSFPVILSLASRPRALAAAVAGSYLVAGAANLALRRWLGSTDPMAFFFWLVQLPAFASGCWLATLSRPAAGRWCGRVVLAAAAAGLVIDSQLRGRSNLLIAIALLTTLTWAAGVARPRWLEWRLLPLVGRVSFSLYILQFAVLALLTPVAPTIEAAVGATTAYVAIFALALAITGALSLATYQWIERPGIALGRRLGAGAGPS